MPLIADERLRYFFQFFGLVVFSYTAIRSSLRLLNNIGTFFFGFGSVDFKKYGSWAVVTGCTDGIGKVYADQLARKGMNIVLISRTLEKLEKQSDELKQKYPLIQTLIISADFTEPSSIYPNIREKLADLDIGLLFNNVGMSYSYPEYFDVYGQSEKNINDMINCNITSLTKMTAIVLPGMLKKKKGIIVNNASASGRVPTPFLTMYSATKAYVDFFSRALSIEYKSKGIIIQSLCPFFVSTNMSKMRPSLFVTEANSYASSALKTINTQPVTNGCFFHNFQGWISEDVLPRDFLNRNTSKIMLQGRDRILKKLEKKKQN